jgi:FKBP-type peptidyl-prolyl cis-trans isomerase
MSEKHGGISQSISGSSEVTQQAAIGNNNQQTLDTQLKTESGRALSTAEIVELLNQIAECLRVSTLPDTTKEDAMTYLKAAKRATEREDPKKETAAINLKEMAETLENATKTVEASKSLWEKVQPILIQVAQWLGVAAGSLWKYLS